MRKILVVTTFLLALTFTACASNDPGNPQTTASPTSSGALNPEGNKVTLNITTTDDGYDSRTYTVPAGAEVTVNMTNNGDLEHVFDILKLGEHVKPPYQATDEGKILWELVVPAGTTKSGTFTAPTEPGEYDIICKVPGHIQTGMIATLIVE